MEDEKEHICFDINGVEIIAALNNDIYIKGYIWKEGSDSIIPSIAPEVDFNECMIIIDRKLFFEAFNFYLDKKKEYCESFGHPCGVFGNIEATTFDEEKNNNNFVNIKERQFRIKSIDSYVDMEHG